MTETQKEVLIKGVCAAGCAVAGAAIAHYLHNKKQSTSVLIQEPDNVLSDIVPPGLSLSKATPGIPLGLDPHNPDRYVGKGLSEDGHVIVVGGSGSGKTTNVVLPTLKQATSGSNIVLDVKGDLPEQWRQQAGHGKKKCLVLAPYDLSEGNCYYDPFVAMEHNPEYLVDYAYQLAQTLIPQNSDQHNQIWRDTAVAYVTGVIIYCYHQGLSFVETLEKLNLCSISELVKEINTSDDSSAVVYMSKLADMEERTIAGIGMELVSSLALLSTSDAIQSALTPSEYKELLDWDALSTAPTPTDVILVFPEDKLAAMRPVMCMICDQLLESLSRRPQRTYDSSELPPICIILDEFSRLGHIPALKDGLTTLRSRGVTMVLTVQSISCLDEIYGTYTAQVIMENCAYKVIFDCADPKGQQYLSDLIGTTAIRTESPSVNLSWSGLSISKSFSETRRPLIYPHAFHHLGDRVVICSPQGAFQARKRPRFPKRQQVADSSLSTSESEKITQGISLPTNGEAEELTQERSAA